MGTDKNWRYFVALFSNISVVFVLRVENQLGSKKFALSVRIPLVDAYFLLVGSWLWLYLISVHCFIT